MSQRSPQTRYFSISQGAAGQTTLVAAIAGKTIVLKSLVVTMSAAGTLKLQSDSNDISGALPLASNGGVVCPPSGDEPYAETNPGEALKITTTTGLAKGFGSYTVES